MKYELTPAKGAYNHMKFVEAFRPSWEKIGVALILGYVLGWIIGPFLYWLSSCSSGGADCAAYSPSRIVVAYVFSWPVFFLKSIFDKYVHMNMDTLNPFASGNPGILFVWAYYYVLVCLPGCFKRVTTRE